MLGVDNIHTNSYHKIRNPLDDKELSQNIADSYYITTIIMLDAPYRIVLLGETGVGKTALSIQMVCNNLNENVNPVWPIIFSISNLTNHAVSMTMTLQSKTCIGATSL